MATGFDYSGVKQVMKLTKIKNKGDAFARLQILENETLKIRAEKQKEE